MSSSPLCSTVGSARLATTLFAALAVSGPATAASIDAASSAPLANTFRVCASDNAAPFSQADGAGFENRIAEAIAAAMGKKDEPFWLSKPPIYLIRDALEKNTCDVVVGMDTGDERVLTTKPYYRSGYVFITRADKHLDISSWKDPRILKLTHIAVSFGSPSEVMLKEIGKYEDNANYVSSLVGFKSPRNQYVQVDPAKMVSEVAAGHADMAVAFAPEVARYVKASAVPLRMTLITDDATRNEGKDKVEQYYSQSMGVRKNDPELLAQLDAALVKAKPQIHKILEQEGIPLLPVE